MKGLRFIIFLSKIGEFFILFVVVQ